MNNTQQPILNHKENGNETGRSFRPVEPMVGQQFAYKDRLSFKDTVIISWKMRWGGSFHDRFWTAEFNDEIEDYGKKKYLIDNAMKLNRKWIVLRISKGMICTIVEAG